MKFFLSVYCLLAVSAVLAQPTIVQSSAPTPGDTWYEYNHGDMNAVTLGTGGADQMWDLSEPSGEFTSGTLEFVSPSDLPPDLQDQFPGSDLALLLEEDGEFAAQYFNILSDGLYVDGSYQPSEDEITALLDFVPDDLLFPFEMAFGETRDHQSRLTVESSVGPPFIQFTSDIISELVYDGHGMVMTPAGSFDNVARILISKYQVDSTYVDNTGNGVYELVDASEPTEPTTQYFFLQNSSPFLVANVEVDPEDETVVDFTYYSVDALSIEENAQTEDLLIFPNPAADLVNVAIPWNDLYVIELVDGHGKLVFSASAVGTTSPFTIDLSEFSAGLYTLRLVGDGIRKSQRLLVE